MSRIRADKISNKAGTGAVQLQYGAEVPVGYGITGAGTINVTGNIQSASGFTGNVTGTAGGLTGTPDITVNNIVASAATFSGNVSVGGTLTYEDVTNVDSVGLITARNGINISDTTQASSTTTGALKVAGGVGIVKNLHVGGTITGDGSNLTGITQTTINNNADNRLITGSGTANTLEGESTLTYTPGSNYKLAITGADSYLNIGTNNKRTEIRNNSTSTYLYSYADSTFHVALAGSGNRIQFDWVSGIMCTMNKNGAVNLYFNNNEKITTTNTGAVITGICTATSFKLADGSDVGGVTSDAQFNTVGGTNSGDAFTGNNANNNTLFGFDTGTDIDSGDDNTCIGYRSGEDITSGSANTLIGSIVGERITTTGSNTGLGYYAMAEVTGGSNTAVGAWALKDASNCTGSVAIGMWALYSNAGGNYNIGVGFDACRGNYSYPADYKIGIGYHALRNARGNYNIGIGYRAGSDSNGNVFNTGTHNITIGHQSGILLSSGSDNTIMGPDAGDALASGSNNLILGHDAAASSTSVSNEITLGDANITSFRIPGISYTATSSTLTYGGDISLSEGKKTIFGSNSGSGAYIKHQSGNFELKNQTGNFYFDNVGALHFRTGASYTTALTINPDQTCTFAAGVNIGPGVLAEKVHVSGSAATGTIDHDVLTHGMVWYSPSNATGTWTFNCRGSASTSFDSLLNNGETTTMTMYVGNNSAANYMTAFQIQGATQTVEWAGGTAPSAGTGSGYDVYTVTIIKTASNAYKCFGNFTNFN